MKLNENNYQKDQILKQHGLKPLQSRLTHDEQIQTDALVQPIDV